ncbi:MAG: gatC [Ferruginibacter sp.]|nr:gatC [Ferruginibacter sp.]
MEVTDGMIDKLATLARLEFNGAEKSSIKTDLQRMIGFIQKMEEVDTTGVAPLLHIGNTVNVLRKDQAGGNIGNEAALKNASVRSGEFFVVSKVIQK